MTAEIYDFQGYRMARLYEDAARDADPDYADILDGLAETYRRRALAGAGRDLAE
jgi:hypothetical protein